MLSDEDRQRAEQYDRWANDCEAAVRLNSRRAKHYRAEAQAIRDRDKLPDLAGMPDGTVLRWRDGDSYVVAVKSLGSWRKVQNVFAAYQFEEHLRIVNADPIVMVEGERLYTGGPADDTQEQNRGI